MQALLTSPSLVLASSSRYRRELLGRLRLPFTVDVPNIDESSYPNERPQDTALRLAQEKARAVAIRHPEALIIGSDQVATLDDEQIGKPGNHARALEQLQRMRGRDVIFHTALCLFDARTGLQQHKIVPTYVRFRVLDDAQLDAYLRLEQPYDCAGSAKSEGLGIALIESMQSDDPTALIGLPLIALSGMLWQVGIPFFNPHLNSESI
jgi:septum formation protein